MMRNAIEAQEKARVSADLAMKYRFAILDKTSMYFMGMKETDKGMFSIALINERYSAMHYAASRAFRDEGI